MEIVPTLKNAALTRATKAIAATSSEDNEPILQLKDSIHQSDTSKISQWRNMFTTKKEFNMKNKQSKAIQRGILWTMVRKTTW